jgi:hypothetical protein
MIECICWPQTITKIKHQRGKNIMAQGILNFQYEREKTDTGMTALGGLPVYLDLAQVAGLSKSISKHLRVRDGSQGWSDSQAVLSMALLSLAGGDCMDDLQIVEADDGFCRVLRRVEMHGSSRRERRKQEKRWRKEKRRSVPSPSAGFRYLEAFHDPQQEQLRQPGKAFIPVPNQYLQGFLKINRDLVGFVQSRNPQKSATLDMDAVLVATNKAEALHCYKGYQSYQPLNTWWAEAEMILHTEFRDGNVPAGYEQLRVFCEALDILPAGVEKVRFRSDTAGYQHNLLRYCDMGENQRFGKIEFAVCRDVTPEFKEAVAEVEEQEWKPLYKKIKVKGEWKWKKSGQEWAEVCFVPAAIGHSKKGPEYRYLAIREALSRQLTIPGEEKQPELPFQALNMQGLEYKLLGMVTNMDWAGQELIHWQRERCGKSEQAHSMMKEDFTGGKLPSGKFGENAAWWWIMILALNLNQAMKRLVLGESWVSKRMKAIRFALINLPGRVIERSRKLVIRLGQHHPNFDWLIEIRARIAMLGSVTLVPEPS